MGAVRQGAVRWRAGAVATFGLVLAALSLAACGDDTSRSSSTPSTTSTAADAGLSVTVTPTKAAAGDTIEAAVVNDSTEQFTYGAAYELERQVGNDFEPVKLPPKPTILIGYVADAGETGPPVKVEIPKDAVAGQYRVVIQRDVPDVGDLSGEFEVTAGN